MRQSSNHHPLRLPSASWPRGRLAIWNLCDRPWSRCGGVSAVENEKNPLDSAVVGDMTASDDNPVAGRRRVEAVLLFHRGPVTLRKLAQLAGLADATAARTLLRKLNEIYDQSGSALRIEEVAGGYQMLTRPGLAPWLRRFASTPTLIRLSTPAMETLAIVAYRQPVLRANIEAIRGVACGEILRQLMQRDLVRICGRSDDLGRPYLYGTTKHFLASYGLKDALALPTMTGAGVQDDPVDTIEPSILSDVSLSAVSSFDAVTQKESDVSTACVLDDLAEPLDTFVFSPPETEPTASSAGFQVRGPRAADDDDDEYFADEDDEDDDIEDDADDEDDWDDDDDEDDVEADDAEEDEAVEPETDDAAEEWKEVGDEEEDEDDAAEDDADEDDADEDDEDDEDEDWDDDEDEDWDDDDDEDEEWD